MKFGIHIGHMGGPLGEMRKLWKFADARGFDWFSVSDHFQESPPRGGEMDCYEAIATLTAAAMDTTRIRLGSGVYCVAYRNPGLLAKHGITESGFTQSLLNPSDSGLTGTRLYLPPESQVGQPVSGSNFREDVNANGTISATDVALVKSDVGTALPP